MVTQSSLLDTHAQQIKQLQSDVTAIKDSLKKLHDDRSESREFQKFIFNWMHHQDSRSNSMSISHVPASSSGLNSTSPTSIAQAPSSLVQFTKVESQVDGNSIDHGSLIERVVDRSSDS
ncbi:hypothetical protein HanLR1_Chr02g0041661 [Helianthus annuus]|nr:hypothetical protein HanHA89_Chr02g0043111 [Helianthus annuus]KAJ0776092.1 hypothetical protein HanLR1_Chr02g0041661 [Helianthus annuus]